MNNIPDFEMPEEISKEITKQASEITAGFNLTIKMPLFEPPAPSSSFKKMMDEMAGPQINLHQLFTKKFKIPSLAINDAVNANSEAMNRLQASLVNDPEFTSMTLRMQSLAGMDKLSESMAKVLSQHQGIDLSELARFVASSPEVRESVSGIAHDNSHEDLEDAGLVNEGGEVPPDTATIEEFQAIVARLESGMDVDWGRVTPIVVHLFSILAFFVTIVNPGAGAAIQAGGSAIGLSHEALKGK